MKRKEGREDKGKGKRKVKRRGSGREREMEGGRNLRNVGRTDTQMILYSVQCYALHWTDNEGVGVL